MKCIQQIYYLIIKLVVDIIGVLTNSKNPRHYWNVLKDRLKDEGNETVTNCDQLKLKVKDGKYRMINVCNIEEMFRIIESIPIKNAEPAKLWLAKLDCKRKKQNTKITD